MAVVFVNRQGSAKTVIAAMAVVLLWASAFVAVRVALGDVSPGQLALARYAIAAAVFVVVVVARGSRMPRGRDLPRLAIAGGVGIALYNLALNTGQQTVNAGIASLLVNTVPIWTMLLSMLLLKERINFAGWVGAFVSFAGVAVIGLHRSGWGGFETGTLLILVAALSQAFYFVIAKPLLDRYHPIEVTAYAVWFGCLFLLPFHRGLIDAVRSSSASTIVSIIFLGIGPAALAYLAWSYVLSRRPAGEASNALFLVPVAALALGWLVLREIPSGVAVTGGAIAIGGVLVSKGILRSTQADST